MSSSRRSTHVPVVGTVMAAGLIVVAAACVLAQPAAEDECKDGAEPIGELGISGLAGEMTIFLDDVHSQTVFRFQSEPEITGLDPEGPAVSSLQIGDVIVAIGGHLITTKKGGRLFSNPPIGEEVELSVRRNGRKFRVGLVPVAVCPEEARVLDGRHVRMVVPRPPAKVEPGIEVIAVPAPAAGPARPDEPDLPEVPEVLAMKPMLPLGWIGAGLTCDLTVVKWNEDQQRADWQFENSPEIYSVDPEGPADKAGLRRGDKITHIDGIRLDTPEGGERFSSLQPQEQVVWTVRRGMKVFEVAMAAGQPEYEVAIAPAPDVKVKARLVSAPSHLRYAGSIGSTGVEVRGPGQVVVSVDEGKNEIIIVTDNATIKLWQTADGHD